MIYNDLKIIHILSASLLLMSFFLSSSSFFKTKNSSNYLQKQTILSMIPLAIFQLFSGFTMLSLQSISLTPFWVKGSLLGFMVLIVSWITFIFFAHKSKKKSAITFLIISLVSLLSMIFLMSSKI